MNFGISVIFLDAIGWSRCGLATSGFACTPRTNRVIRWVALFEGCGCYPVGPFSLVIPQLNSVNGSLRLKGAMAQIHCHEVNESKAFGNIGAERFFLHVIC